MRQRSLKLNIRRGLIFLFSMTVALCFLMGRVSATQPSNPDQLVKQGIERYQAGNYKDAIAHWKSALPAYANDPSNRAIVLENIARAYQQSNQTSDAIQTWNQLIASYRQDRNIPKLRKALVEQAQLYSSIGQPKQAIALLCAPKDQRSSKDQPCSDGTAIQLAKQGNDPITLAAALGSLGDAYRLSGDYDPAIEYLKQALDLTQDNPAYRIATLNSLANAHLSRGRLFFRRAESARSRIQATATELIPQTEAARLNSIAKEDETKALTLLDESLKLAQSKQDQPGQLRSLLSITSIYQRNRDLRLTQTLPQAIALLNQIPKNRVRVYATIDLARFAESTQAESLLTQAISLATELEDDRARSFALGELGALYERQNKDSKALDFTRQAVLAADQRQDAKDSLYRWEWQTGRLLAKNPQNIRAAIAAYERAVQTLEEIRSDILSANVDLQFDFRQTVEPVYRQLIALRLQLENNNQSNLNSERNKQQNSRTPQKEPTENNVALVLTAMDSLRLAELQNYFGNECVIAAINRIPSNITTEENKSVAIQSILSNSTQDRKTAILNHILLPDQVILVLNLPDGGQHTVSVPVSRTTIEKDIIAFRQLLEQYYDKADFDLTLSQSLYKTLVEPLQPYLTQGNIETLVFVQDGLLRSIPMAALHDGTQYLIEKYAIATTPSLSLIDLTPFNRANLRALALGVTQEIQLEDTQRVYKALEFADEELDAVLTELPGSRKFELLKANLQNRLQEQPFPIVHIATHGQFGADPKDTFLVTGDRKRLTIEEFEQILRSRTSQEREIDLLMLTACQTGVGDDRATLGLAGVAIQAGAKSALASLWFVNDESTASLVKQFYSSLRNPALSKAKAVQNAQKALIQEAAHPGLWSSFILVGNWL